MITRAVENFEEFYFEQEVKNHIRSLCTQQDSFAKTMLRSPKADLDAVDSNLLALALDKTNDLIGYFKDTMNEYMDASNSAAAAALYPNMIDATQLQNQILAWKDKTLPHGGSKVAKVNILRLIAMHDRLLKAIRETMDKQFFGPEFVRLELDFAPKSGPQTGLKPLSTSHVFVTMWFYYYRGKRVPENIEASGWWEKEQAQQALNSASQDEYLKATEWIRPLGDMHQNAVADLDILIAEESAGMN